MGFTDATTWADDASQITADWLQGRGAFGGLITASGLRGALAALPDLPVRSVTTRFLAPARPGPIRRDVAVMTSGKAVSTVRARIWSADTLAAEIDVVLGPRRPSRLRVPGPPMVAGPGPDAGFPVVHIPDVTPAFLQHADLRLLDGSPPFSGGDDPSTGGWCRWKDGALDTCALVALIDAWPPAVIGLGIGPFPSATVTWTVHLTGASSVGEYLRFHAHTVASGDGFATTLGHLWGADGALVAWSEQLVAVFDPA